MKYGMKTEVYTTTIPGEPIAKARPRMTKNGHTYTPKRTVDYERMVQTLFYQKYGSPKIEGAVLLELELYMGIPKSASKKRKARMLSHEERPTKRPDLDNCLKAVCDALNGIAYKDDSQIVGAVVQKFYSDEPRVEIEIKKLGD